MTDLEALQALLGPRAHPVHLALEGEHGTALPPLVDHHVHLALIDEAPLAARGLAAVVDLGGDPVALAQRLRPAIPRVAYAGAFLTAPGGYPSDRSWAPDGIWREVRSAARAAGAPGGATTLVDEQAEFGASVIKVSLNADAGPVLDADALDAIIARAHERGLPVLAHVEGPRMARLAIEHGVDALAHTPFSELLPAGLIHRAAAAHQRWVSTLDIHEGADRERATANLAAFALAGGTVLYGTDLGNGDRPPGVSTSELRALHDAGVQGPALIATLTDPWPLAKPPSGVATFVPGPVPVDADRIPDWLGTARVVPREELTPDPH
jgi:imidazolonepropionase-like amidohydrolase